MKVRTTIAMIWTSLFTIISVLLFLQILAPYSFIYRIPFFHYVELASSYLSNHLYISLFSDTINSYIIPSVSLFYALFFLITRNAMSFWWMVPYSAFTYYSSFILTQLLAKKIEPRFIMEKLNQSPTMALILMILLLLLEVTIFILFSIISVKLYQRAKAKRKTINTKNPKKKKSHKIKKEDIKEELLEKEIHKECDKTTPRSTSLSFPKIQEIPSLKTISPSLEKQDEVYIGKLNMIDDSTMLLTDIPLDSIDEEKDEVIQRREPFEALKRQLKLDETTKGVKVPSRMPAFVQEKRKVEVAPFENTQVNQEKPKDNASQTAVIPGTTTILTKNEQDIPVESDDIDYISGVGGLVSVNDPQRALLTLNKIKYQYPSPELLDSYPNHTTDVDQDTIDAGDDLMETLRQFKIEAKVSAIIKGPTVTMYEITLAPGVRVSSISNLADNIAMQLAANSVRIVAPIPGKQAVGIEVPNAKRSIIGFRDLLGSVDPHAFRLPMILGRKITGEPVVMDLTRTPHLLIAGATGSGKSVCVNSLISSLLYFKSPKEVRLILVDPKIVELRIYNGIPHLLTPVITEPKKTIKALEYCLFEMERRYKLLNSIAVRNIGAYNSKVSSSHIAREKLPYIVVVIDEFADIMTTVGKELETLLARLAAMARAVGIHLVLATQRPSADVITGIIKSNIPTRIAFTVSGQVNSRIIIDETGAEKLLGGGDMLFVPSWEPSSTRIQGAFLSDDEVERVVNYVKSQGEPDYLDESFFEDDNDNSRDTDEGEFDEGSDEALREQALKIIIERNGASASYLQRRLRIGYNKAARIIEMLEEEGVLGPSRGSKPREIIRLPN